MKLAPHRKLNHLNRFISCLFLMVITIALTSCASSPAIQSMKTQSVYDRVIQSGIIRAAYVIYPPYCMKDPNSHKLSGIGPEALELIAKKLGLQVNYTEEAGWGNMVEGLNTNRYDIQVMPVWTNAARAKVAWFSKPTAYNPCFLYAHKGDHRFSRHYERANSPDITISTIDGETGAVIAEADFPKARRLSMPQMTDITQNYLNVATKKADLVISEPGMAGRFMKQNPGTLEIVDATHPVRIYPGCWLIKRGESEFKEMIDIVLDEIINSGQMDRIIYKYEKDPLAVFPVAKSYRSN